MDKYIGKKSILINDNILVRDAPNGLINNVADEFRKMIGNHYVLEFDKGLYFQTTKYSKTTLELLTGNLENSEVPNVIMTQSASTPDGIEVHDVEVKYKVMPNIERSPAGVPNTYEGSMYDRGSGIERDEPTTGYEAPQTQQESTGATMQQPQHQGTGVEAPNGNIVQGDYTPTGSVIFQDGAVSDYVNDGSVRNMPEVLEGSSADDFLVDYPFDHVAELDKYEASLNMMVGTTYNDFNVEFNKPYTREELETINNINRPLMCDVEGGYNFYHKQFEDKYYNSNTKEVDMPNLYDMYANNTVAGNILANTSIETLLSMDLEQEPYKNISLNFNEDSDIKNWNDYASSAFSMPSSAKINIGMEESKISGYMSESMVNSTFLIDYSSDYLNDYNNFLNMRFNEQVSSLAEDIQEGTTTTKIKREDHNLKTYDFAEWINRIVDISNGTEDELEREVHQNLTMFDVYDNGIEVIDGIDALKDSSTLNTYMITMLLSMLKSKLNKIVMDTKRGYDDIFSGKKAYQETLLYTVQKKKTKSNKVIQNYIFFNSNSDEIFKYVDSQIKYGEEYTYEVKAHKAVFGTSYQYSNITRTNDSVKFNVLSIPDIRIIEVPYYTKSIMVLDSPPIVPEIQIYPYRDLQDRILIELNNGIGETHDVPVSIKESDELIIENMIKYSVDKDVNKIRYKSDDIPEYFEAYRIDKEPKSYRDFEGHMIKKINTKIDTTRVSNVSMVDIVGENKEAYYTFRTIDNHGNMSNPTDIYMVKLITHGDRVMPIIESHNIDYYKAKLEDYKQKEKSLKRFIMIKPAVQQEIIDPVMSGFEDLYGVEEVESNTSQRFGVVPVSVWGKNYKLRVKSKSTGRMIDINFKFINKRIDDN